MVGVHGLCGDLHQRDASSGTADSDVDVEFCLEYANANPLRFTVNNSQFGSKKRSYAKMKQIV